MRKRKAQKLHKNIKKKRIIDKNERLEADYDKTLPA